MDITEGLGYKFDREAETQKRRSKRLRGRDGGMASDALPRAKIIKKPNRRKSKAQARKNRPHKDLAQMNLECCTPKTCLLNQGRHDCINFDLEVLPKTKNRRDSPPWVLPPLWK